MEINYQEYWEKYSMTYAEYNDIMDQQVIDGLTSGPTQNEALANFTKLNDSRMQRLDKKLAITEENINEINKIVKAQNWLVITETWCGDAAQILPMIDKLGDAIDSVTVRYIWRDQFPDLMNAHLTNGAKAIPMVILLDDEYNLLDSWGPRPKIAQQMVMENKEIMGALKDLEKKNAHYQQFQIVLQKWYNKNKGVDIQNELIAIAQSF